MAEAVIRLRRLGVDRALARAGRARRRRGERGGGLLYVVPRPVGRHLDRPEPADDRPAGARRGADRSARRAPSGVRVDERGRRPHRNGRRQGGLVLGHHRRRHDGRSAHRQVVGRGSASLVGDGTDVVVVTSGAITAGWSALGRPGPRSEDLSVLQAVSAVGQHRLMRSWEDGLAPHGLLAVRCCSPRSTSCTASSTSTPGPRSPSCSPWRRAGGQRERRRGR